MRRLLTTMLLGGMAWRSLSIAGIPDEELRQLVRPLPPGAAEVRFLVFGDMGRGDTAQHHVARAMASVCRRDHCDLAITTGDNIYPAGVRTADADAFEEKFEAPYRRLGDIDIWMVLGNHDWKGHLLAGAQAQVDRTRLSPRWRMPDIHYAIPGLPRWLHIYGLDTSALEGGIGVFQLPAAARALCDQPGWRMAFGHYPTWSNGAHGNGGHRFVRWALEWMLRRCGVHLYFAGHDHHQEHLRLDGYESVIQGAAGGRLSPVHMGRPNQRFATSTPGFAWVRATPDSLTLRFFDADATLLHQWVTALPDGAPSEPWSPHDAPARALR